jgi:hypothetical protein
MRASLKVFHAYPALQQRFDIDKRAWKATSNEAHHCLTCGDTEYHYVAVASESEADRLLSMRFDAVEYNALVPLSVIEYIHPHIARTTHGQ